MGSSLPSGKLGKQEVTLMTETLVRSSFDFKACFPGLTFPGILSSVDQCTLCQNKQTLLAYFVVLWAPILDMQFVAP